MFYVHDRSRRRQVVYDLCFTSHNVFVEIGPKMGIFRWEYFPRAPCLCVQEGLQPVREFVRVGFARSHVDLGAECGRCLVTIARWRWHPRHFVTKNYDNS